MRLARLLALLALFACVPVGSAVADPYPVTNTNDSGDGSLRAAIVAANSRAGADTIPIQATGTINLLNPLQVIFDPVAIIGPGADLLTVRRSAGAADFSIFGFSTDAGPSSISGLTISNGRAESSGGFRIGGGIRNFEGSLTLTGVVVRGNEAVAAGGANAVAEGGGVFSEGPLTLRETVVAENTARASDGTSQTSAFGGGVAALGALTMERSTVSGNLAEATGGGGVAYAQGGGLLAGLQTTIELSTISGNSVNAEDGGTQTRASGGGLKTSEASLNSLTVTGNSATSSGLAIGANLDSFISTFVRDSILSDPLGDAGSCQGAVFSAGFNLDEDSSCEFDKGTDLEATVAGLAPLADNGGPTPTHALLPGSAAIDRGFSFGLTTDQRNLPRRSNFITVSDTEGGDGSDIGAFELQAPLLPPPVPLQVNQVPGDRQPPNTRIVSGPSRVTFKQSAKFRFASSEAQSSFQCKVDKGRWRGCRNPFKRNVSAGRKHVFKVRAIDRFGNVDPTPARFGWRVEKIGR